MHNTVLCIKRRLKGAKMEIVSIHNNWKDEVLYIDVNLGSVCNYKCWYCWPGSNNGDVKFPDFELIKKNLSHLIRYYENNSPKKVFDIHFCGGEPSHWPKLTEFIKYLKENHNVLISMTSNGSKKMDWWEKAAPYFDRVHLSAHHEFTDIETFRNVCDYLYTKNVIVGVSVMMDPFAWDKCMDMVEYFKKSKKRWTIRYVEIIDPKIEYTEEQQNILKNYRARQCNIFWFLKNNKHYRSKVRAKDINGKTHKFNDGEILLYKLNNFKGWECSVGYNWVAINKWGNISGTCQQLLYGEDKLYNIYDANFTEIFHPKIAPAICSKTSCVCSIETVMPKRKI